MLRSCHFISLSFLFLFLFHVAYLTLNAVISQFNKGDQIYTSGQIDFVFGIDKTDLLTAVCIYLEDAKIGSVTRNILL